MRQIDLRAVVEDAPPGRFHAALLFWSALIVVIDGYDLAIAGIALPSIMKDMNVDPTSAGFMVSSALFGMMFGAICLGTVADRIGRRWTIVASVLLFSLCTAAAGLTKDPITFSVMRFLAGAGIGGVTPCITATMMEYSPRRMQCTLVTMMFTGFSIGGVVAALIGKGLLLRYGWESVFFAAAIPALLVPLFWKTMPESTTFLLGKGDDEAIGRIAGKIDPRYLRTPGDRYVLPFTATGAGTPVRELFLDGRGVSTVMFWVSYIMCLFMVYGLSAWLTKLMASAGYSLGSALTFVLVMNFGAVVGAVAGGWLADRVNIKVVLIGMYILAALSIAGLGYAKSTMLLYLLVAIAGGCTIGTQIVGYAYAGQYYPMRIRATGIGWAVGIGRTGAILAPILIGVLVSMSLSLQHSFIAMAIPALIAIIAVVFIDRGALRAVPRDGAGAPMNG